MNGTIGKIHQEANDTSRWLFGTILFVGLVNLICCTPIYFIVITWLYAKQSGG